MDVFSLIPAVFLVAMTAGCIYAFRKGWPPGPGDR